MILELRFFRRDLPSEYHYIFCNNFKSLILCFKFKLICNLFFSKDDVKLAKEGLGWKISKEGGFL